MVKKSQSYEFSRAFGFSVFIYGFTSVGTGICNVDSADVQVTAGEYNVLSTRGYFISVFSPNFCKAND
jgi:hypothetical protein